VNPEVAATTATASEPGADPASESGRPVEGPAGPPVSPETGDVVIDAALRELADAPADDLDALLSAGEAVHRTLQSRLTDLGG